MSQGLSRSTALYYSEIAKTHPVNDPDEERRLIQRWQRNKDKAARDAIVRAHLRFVVTMAKRRTRNPEKLQDLIAAGNLGLLKALDRFDLRRKTRFLTYAGCWIQEEMFKEEYSTSSLVHVPTHRQKAQRKQAKAYQRALMVHGPDAHEVRQMDPGVPEGTTVPLDLLRETAEDDETRTPFSCESDDARLRLRRAIATLPHREQTVLNLYFGTKDEPRNLVRIATMMGMSPERIRQIKLSGVKLLKTVLTESAASFAPTEAF